MKNMLLTALLLTAGAAYCQTDSDLCQQAQSAQKQGNYSEAMRSAGRALAKNPDAPCRKTRVEAALQMEPSSAHYLTAITDLEYLMRKGDNSEAGWRMMGEAESGLAKLHFENKNFSESGKHYQKAKDAYTKANTAAGSSRYDSQIANADKQMKQSAEQKK